MSKRRWPNGTSSQDPRLSPCGWRGAEAKPVRLAGYKRVVRYQPTDASGAVVLAVHASRALAAAGQGDMGGARQHPRS